MHRSKCGAQYSTRSYNSCLQEARLLKLLMWQRAYRLRNQTYKLGWTCAIYTVPEARHDASSQQVRRAVFHTFL